MSLKRCLVKDNMARTKEEVEAELIKISKMSPEEKLLYDIKEARRLHWGDISYESYINVKLDNLIDALIEYLEKERN
jgi:hypothetical protein